MDPKLRLESPHLQSIGFDPMNPATQTPINTPPPYAAQPTIGQTTSTGSAASISTLTSDDEEQSITQVLSL